MALELRAWRLYTTLRIIQSRIFKVYSLYEFIIKVEIFPNIIIYVP